MSTRRYRATARGRFTGLSQDDRDRLRADQDKHSVFNSSYTPEGMFIYEPLLINYQYRCEIDVDEDNPEDADALALLHVEDRARQALRERGLDPGTIATTAECVNDMKIRRKR